MKFTYKGQDKNSKDIEETVEAKDRYAVYDIARKSGHTVSGIAKYGSWSIRSLINVERLERLISRISTDQLVMMTRNLSSMLSAGLPLSRALSVIERQSKNPKLINVVKTIRERINKGDQFFEALRDHPKVFSNLYVSMIRAGEESGGMAESLQTLSIQLEQSSNMRKKIRGAMIYPGIVITVMAIIGVLMMIYVVPTITETFKSLEVDLPLTTTILIAVSDFMSENALLTLGLIIGSVFGFLRLLRTRIGMRVFHWLIIRLPVIGTMVKETNSARTARTLSSLLKAGVAVVEAIKITEEVVQNIYFKAVVAEVAVRVEKGNELSEVFIERNDLYPVLLGEMISVGEETGDISQMLIEVADFYENEVERKTKDMSTIIEPLLMVVIGGTVGFFALAMIAPIYSISDSI